MDKDEEAAMQSSLEDVYATLAEIREHLFAAQEAVWHENVEQGVQSSRQAVAEALRACHKHKIGLQALTAQFPGAMKAERSAEKVGGDRKPPVPTEQQQDSTPRVLRAESAGSGPIDKKRDDLGRAASALEQSMISIDDVVRRGMQTRPTGQSSPPSPHPGKPQQQHVQQHKQYQHQHHQNPNLGPAMYSSRGSGEGSGSLSSRGSLSESQGGSGGGRYDADARRRGGAATMVGQYHQQQHQQAGMYPAAVASHVVMDRDIVYSQQDWQPAPNSARGNGQVSYSSLKSQEEYDYAAAIRVS